MYLNNEEKPLFKAIYDRMLDMGLWNSIDISMAKKRYELIEVSQKMILEDVFKEKGFKIEIIDGMNFIQKVPYFIGNKEFIDKHKLYFNDKPCYNSYLKYMSNK